MMARNRMNNKREGEQLVVATDDIKIGREVSKLSLLGRNVLPLGSKSTNRVNMSSNHRFRFTTSLTIVFAYRVKNVGGFHSSNLAMVHRDDRRNT